MILLDTDKNTDWSYLLNQHNGVFIKALTQVLSTPSLELAENSKKPIK